MITQKISNYIKATKYNIGFVEQDLQSVIDGKPISVSWMKHSNFSFPVRIAKKEMVRVRN